MTSEAQSSNMADPLSAYSGLALFPKTFGSFPNLPRPSDPDDTDYIHDYLRSLALRSPNKCLEQAKAVMDSSSEILNSKMTSYAALKDKKDGVAAKVAKDPQERRPDLGRKRARFSLKTTSSHPNVNLEPSLDIDQLKDPEEFFLAYEKFENAKREIQKQVGGVLTNTDHYNSLMTTRSRRPGILGRSAKYKHHYSPMLSENNEANLSSQDLFEDEMLSPNQSLQKEASIPNVASQERELAGSTTKKVNRVDELLDELLSISCEDLDGDGAVALLQERLRIKPIDIEKLCVPDLQSIQQNNSKPRKPLLSIQNLFKGTSSNLPKKLGQKAESTVHGFASPIPQKSPFSSISLLNRHIQQLNSSSDPFSALNIDEFPLRNSSIGHDEKISGQINTENEFNKYSKLVSSTIEEDDTVAAKGGSPDAVAEESSDQLGKSVNESSSEFVGLSGSHVDLKDNIAGSDVDENLIKYTADVEIQTSELNKVKDRLGNIDVASSGSYVDLEDNVARSCMNENLIRHATDVEIQTNEQSELNRVVEAAVASAQPDLNVESVEVEKANSNQGHLDQSSLDAVEDHEIVGCSESLELSPKQLIQKEASKGSVNEQSKAQLSPCEGRKRKQHSHKQSLAGPSDSCEPEILDPSQGLMNEHCEADLHPRKERKRKELSRRQSLAGAGTKWEAGVRRSTRFRTRPLEYWKGERLLYGRIHESLATVIGMKYVSPAKGGGNPTVKVKSFVSDQYQELIDLAARH